MFFMARIYENTESVSRLSLHFTRWPPADTWWRRRAIRIRSGIRRLNEEMPNLTNRIENLKADLAIRRDTRGEAFEIQIETQIHRDRTAAGEDFIQRQPSPRTRIG